MGREGRMQEGLRAYRRFSLMPANLGITVVDADNA